jgi:hypothetical protein
MVVDIKKETYLGAQTIRALDIDENPNWILST